MNCPLTPRQIKVVEELSSGIPAKTAADHLRLTINMVNNDIQRAIRAANSGNAAGLVAKAIREGWIS